MVVDVWKKCAGLNNIQGIKTIAWRIVETQEMTAIRKLVDSFEEYEILERLIESQKPLLKSNLSSLHPLLYTPFRYPPLKYGSRFGGRFEPALWYGSLNINSSLAEKAFYQLNFLRGSNGNFGIVESLFTAFSTKIKTSHAVKLEQAPFSDYVGEISSPVSYNTSQHLGKNMRLSQIEAFTYQSARDPLKGINIGLFTANAFLNNKPDELSFHAWKCISNKEVVEFMKSSAIENDAIIFPVQTFLIGNELPFPAN